MNTSSNLRISQSSSAPFSSWAYILVIIILLFPIPTKAMSHENADNVEALEKHLVKMLMPQDGVIISGENNKILLVTLLGGLEIDSVRLQGYCRR